MDLYLMQHGEAKAEQEDPERPLTEGGRQAVEQVAAVASRLSLGIRVVLHSGKLRARQTAEIVASRLSPAPELRVMDGLGPKDDPSIAAQAVAAATEASLIVGHMPHLSRLASLLLVGDASREVVAFRMGALVALARQEGWSLRFILTPEIAGAL